MPATRKLSDRTTGMFADRTRRVGQYDEENLGLTSGLGPYAVPGQTRGNPGGDSYAFNIFPYAVSGQMNINPSSLAPGSNLSAVQQGAYALAKDAGLDDTVASENPSGLTGMTSSY